MNTTLLALGLLTATPMQTVYLHRTFPAGVKDTYLVTVTINNNPPIKGKLVATTSSTVPNQREMMFEDERALRSKVGIREPMTAVFDSNGLFLGGDLESPRPVYIAFALASFVPNGSIALDRSAGTNYENARIKLLAMTHVENNSDANAYANLETIATIEPRNNLPLQATIRNTVQVSTGRMDKAHLEVRRGRDSRMVADFQLVESKGG